MSEHYSDEAELENESSRLALGVVMIAVLLCAVISGVVAVVLAVFA